MISGVICVEIHKKYKVKHNQLGSVIWFKVFKLNCHWNFNSVHRQFTPFLHNITYLIYWSVCDVICNIRQASINCSVYIYICFLHSKVLVCFCIISYHLSYYWKYTYLFLHLSCIWILIHVKKGKMIVLYFALNVL